MQTYSSQPPACLGRQRCTDRVPSPLPFQRCSSRRRGRVVLASNSGDDGTALPRDPDAPLRHYGKWFGKVFKLPAWIDEAPRVRVRTIAKRQMDDLVELAVVNERLSGEHTPWEARNRLELLRTRRKNWEHIYNYVTKQEAAATLDLIEQANQQVCSTADKQQSCP